MALGSTAGRLAYLRAARSGATGRPTGPADPNAQLLDMLSKLGAAGVQLGEEQRQFDAVQALRQAEADRQQQEYERQVAEQERVLAEQRAALGVKAELGRMERAGELDDPPKLPGRDDSLTPEEMKFVGPPTVEEQEYQDLLTTTVTDQAPEALQDREEAPPALTFEPYSDPLRVEMLSRLKERHPDVDPVLLDDLVETHLQAEKLREATAARAQQKHNVEMLDKASLAAKREADAAKVRAETAEKFAVKADAHNLSSAMTDAFLIFNKKMESFDDDTLIKYGKRAGIKGLPDLGSPLGLDKRAEIITRAHDYAMLQASPRKTGKSRSTPNRYRYSYDPGMDDAARAEMAESISNRLLGELAGMTPAKARQSSAKLGKLTAPIVKQTFVDRIEVIAAIGRVSEKAKSYYEKQRAAGKGKVSNQKVTSILHGIYRELSLEVDKPDELEFQSLKSSWQDVLNKIIKQRSGAAVTDGEMRRLYLAFGGIGLSPQLIHEAIQRARTEEAQGVYEAYTLWGGYDDRGVIDPWLPKGSKARARVERALSEVLGIGPDGAKAKGPGPGWTPVEE